MRKVLVTGASGFIGNYVIQELIRQEYHVIASSTSLEKARKFPWFEQVKYTPLNISQCDPQVNYHAYFDYPDIVIHLAWEGLPNYKSDFHLKNNLPTHANFLRNLIENGLKDLTVSGTCFEYGLREGCLSEELTPEPGNAYAEAKNRLRELVQAMADVNSVSFKWVRFFYLYGQGQSPNSLLSQLQNAVNNGEDVFNMSPGDQLRDYLPIETAAAYLVKIATQTRIDGVVNCCSGRPITVMDLVKEYLRERGLHINLNPGFYPYSDLEPRNFWGDTRKLKTIVQYE